ncbi:enoyl-CoA-hydratase DpgB [Streptomyces sp. NPDC088194]|jgi:isomerase DpgB|uniref:enoyl-CoA-hydratase DpgB n=1 Tax=Streptomyces sp. NPDC088194 TaxID=3154931 RepID=UPI00344D2D6C
MHATISQTVVEADIDVARPLTPGLVAELADACDRVEDAGGGRVLVVRLTGSKDAPAAWPGPAQVHLVGKWENALRRLERLDALTVGIVAGRCNQACLEVLLATDHRVAGPGTTLDAGTRTDGMWPGTALYRLVQQVGLATARRLVLFPGETGVPALHAAGVLDEVTQDAGAALAAVLKRAADSAGTEPALRRRLLLDAGTVSFEEALGSHLAACDRALRRTDLTEDGK